MDASQLKVKTKKNNTLRLMFKWMGKHWYLLVIAFCLIYVISYARTLIPLFTQHIIDYVLNYSNNGSTLPNYLFVLVEAPDTKTQLILAA
ncbi:MAG: hypothetical protein PHQ30_06185, partial [Candidatus Izemoplasmatales bacterium]|nr:hypothetical protein [Candidatus Izemoplasmatales bacterium]